MAFLFRSKSEPVTPEQALPGRDTPLRISGTHAVNGASIVPPFPAGTELAEFGMGCFWGAERLFWQTPGVVATAVGYSGGHTPNPTYQETCTGRTGHAETVLVVFDPAQVSYEELLRVFWEGHDPTTENRQGNDVGTQYRSAIYAHFDAQLAAAEASEERYEQALGDVGRLGPIVTEIKPAGPFYYAEEEHQQYLHKVPNGYCGLGGTGVSCPIGVGVDAA